MKKIIVYTIAFSVSNSLFASTLDKVNQNQQLVNKLASVIDTTAQKIQEMAANLAGNTQDHLQLKKEKDEITQKINEFENKINSTKTLVDDQNKNKQAFESEISKLQSEKTEIEKEKELLESGSKLQIQNLEANKKKFELELQKLEQNSSK